mgnify:FL=1
MRSPLSAMALAAIGLVACFAWPSAGHGQTVLFEDTFDKELSDKWEVVGLERADYRVRDGALELRLKQLGTKDRWPLLRVNLPFSTADTVVASVDVKVIGEPLPRGAMAALCLSDQDGAVFTVRKTNLDGRFVLAPGEVEFIGNPGQEGDPGKYTVKYWPADESFGPLRVIVRGHYAHFQVGPSETGDYKTFFHSAIGESDKGMGFGLTVIGNAGDGEHWARFDNFRVTMP